MTILSRSQIDAVGDLAPQEVEVPQWGGSVLLRMLSGSERGAIEAAVSQAKTDGKSVKNLRVRLVALGLVDERGERLYRDDELDRLGARSAAVLERLCDLVMAGSGLKKDAVEEEEKNSESDPA